ncbi:MAG TPA: hypothetical protein VF837_04400 [Patescibacteria group bacterium]
MSNQKFEITNPEAIELINRIKSGTIWQPISSKLSKYKWILIGFFVLIGLFIAISIGKKLSQQATPKYLPPSLSEVTPTKASQVRSTFDPLKKSIIDFSSQLPNPAIPATDNSLSLEQTLIQ